MPISFSMLLHVLCDAYEEQIREIHLHILKLESEARDAPSAMESHSDTTRNQTQLLIQALQHQLDDLRSALTQVNKAQSLTPSSTSISTWSLFRICNDELITTYLLTPNIPNATFTFLNFVVVTLSEASPLGSFLKGKEPGVALVFNTPRGNRNILIKELYFYS